MEKKDLTKRLTELLKEIKYDVPENFYDGEKDDLSYYFHEKVHETFHGTGDVFASVFTGAMVRGVSFSDAASLAADFTVEAIKETMKEENYHTYGVDFEKALPYLMKRSGIL